MDRIKMGNFLSELRKEKDLSQVDLAEIIGVTFQAVSKWERGEAIPDIAILEKLSSFYNVTIEEIINGEHSARIDVRSAAKIYEKKQSEEGFLNQKRAFGFWFALAFLVLYILLGFCPFISAPIINSIVYVTAKITYYDYIFNSSLSFVTWNFFLLIQFITTLGVLVSTMLFYACTTQKAFRSLYIARRVFIIINLATLIINVAIIFDSAFEASVGNYLLLLLILIFDILFLCLKQNRKSYIIKDFQ